MKILITGASGFIGSFLVEEALRRGMETWAAVRPTSSRRYLQDSRIRFIELDFYSEEKLRAALKDHHFDYVVHAAGITKCLDPQEFYLVNTDGTQRLVYALEDNPPKKFVYLSSLSVFGPVKEERPYLEILESDTPQPNTAYGKSKLKAEYYVENSRLPWVILRPTGVYGPREKDYMMMVDSIRHHVDFSVGFKPQDITFVYVKDVVQAVFLALEKDVTKRKYFLTDDNVYSSRTFSDLIHRELGRPWLLRLKAPLWLLRVVTYAGEYIGYMRGKVTALNPDKYHILAQRNWRCDITPAKEELGYRPQYDLERGVKEMLNNG